MLAAIGETLETAGESDPKDSEGLVTGVIISARPVLCVPPCDPPCYRRRALTICSYRISIWTRSAPDLSQPDTDALKAKIIAMGKFFKGDVLSLDDEKRKVVAGGLATEVTFESHKVSHLIPRPHRFRSRILADLIRTPRRRATRTSSLFKRGSVVAWPDAATSPGSVLPRWVAGVDMYRSLHNAGEDVYLHSCQHGHGTNQDT